MRTKRAIAILLAAITMSMGCSRGYRQEAGRWVFEHWNEAYGTIITPVAGADAASFHVLSDKDYAADRNAVYLEGGKIDHADPATFQLMREGYARDAKRVFFVGKEISGADSATFKLLARSSWSCDKTDVYIGRQPLHVRDISSFTLLRGEWAKDALAYYVAPLLGNSGIVACDYASFVVLSDDYARDKNRGYWIGIPIKGSDGPTFQATSRNRAKDKNGCYFTWEKLPQK